MRTGGKDSQWGDWLTVRPDDDLTEGSPGELAALVALSRPTQRVQFRTTLRGGGALTRCEGRHPDPHHAADGPTAGQAQVLAIAQDAGGPTIIPRKAWAPMSSSCAVAPKYASVQAIVITTPTP